MHDPTTCTKPTPCFGCKIATVSISPKAMPSRRNNIAPRRPNNSWERGIHRHNDGVPILDDVGKPIGLKQKTTTQVTQMLRDRQTAGFAGTSAQRT